MSISQLGIMARWTLTVVLFAAGGCGGNKSVGTGGLKAADRAAGCAQVAVWLKDWKRVNGLRGIDVNEANYQVRICEQDAPLLSKERQAALAAYLENEWRANPADFQSGVKNVQYRARVTQQMNSEFGQPQIIDWQADLYTVQF